MKTWVCVFTLIGIVALSACQSSVPSTPGDLRAAIDAVTTVAWGKLVDDPSGKPLRGVRVALEPWKPCRAAPNVPWADKNQKPWRHHEALVCPKAIVNGTTRADGRFLLRALAGHYLLAIGSDDPADMNRTHWMAAEISRSLGKADRRLDRQWRGPARPSELDGPNLSRMAVGKAPSLPIQLLLRIGSPLSR